MLKFARILASLLLASMIASAQAQTKQTTPTAKRKASIAAKRRNVAAPAVTAEDIRALREAIAAQQQQIQAMQQELQRRNDADRAASDSLRQTQSTASEAASKAATAESTATQSYASVSKLQTDLADVKQNQTSAAVTAQDDQKKLSALESALNRFRFTGDVRLRQETFLGSGTGGCYDSTVAACTPRVRQRIRLRLGIEGRLGEDFVGGVYMASGVLNEPTSTNETMSNFFERKSIGFDRGYISYQPQAHKWLQLTAGKFAYTWQRTSVTFDPDLNPEGFSEKFSFDVTNPIAKNVTFTAMQLFFNEVSAGNDSFAVGGQVSSTLKFFGDRLTLTPSYTLLNWRNPDNLFKAATANGGNSLTTGNIFGSGTTVGTFAPNGLTNSTFLTPTVVGGCTGTALTSISATCVGHFGSQFLYSDFILNTVTQTKFARFPFNLLLEYENNLNAGATAGGTGNGRHAYYGETSVGQTRNVKDFQLGYAFLRQEQDSVISSFAESDQRAPTNILQHRIFFLYKVQKNTVLSYTQWIGRTLNPNLQNSALGPGAPATPRRQEPFLNRLQFDVIYTF